MKTYHWSVKSRVKYSLTADKSQYGPENEWQSTSRVKTKAIHINLTAGPPFFAHDHNFVCSQSGSFLMYLCIPSLHTLPLGKLHGVRFADIWMERHDLEPGRYFLSSSYHLIVFAYSLIYLMDSFSSADRGEGWDFYSLWYHIYWGEFSVNCCYFSICTQQKNFLWPKRNVSSAAKLVSVVDFSSKKDNSDHQHPTEENSTALIEAFFNLRRNAALGHTAIHKAALSWLSPFPSWCCRKVFADSRWISCCIISMGHGKCRGDKKSQTRQLEWKDTGCFPGSCTGKKWTAPHGNLNLSLRSHGLLCSQVTNFSQHQ